MTQVNAKKYTKTAIILHWLIGLAILAMFGLGWYMTDLPKEGPEAIAYDLFDWGIYTWQLSEPQSPRMFYYNLHKSIGVTLLALIAFRIFWRQTHRPPALLNTLKAGEKKFVNAMHHLLYVLMFAVPVSGFIMSIYSKFGIIWFGVPLLPGIDNHDLHEIFEEIHGAAGVVLLVVIILHVAGALKHKFIDKDETMSRMSLR